MTENQQLLADFVKTGSEAAFHELLNRYTNLVYSAAVRLVGGDAHLAQDVTQTVFADFARQARRLPRDLMLGGWLHHHTVYVASNVIRTERRRRAREQEAAAMNALAQETHENLALVSPVLDEAIDQLEPEDRHAILLRFFEQNDFRSVGQALGSTEEAARKRVSRALGKLQSLLQHRGVSLSLAGLGTILATQAVTAAPAGLATAIAGAAFASVGAAAGGTLVDALSMAKLKLVVVGTLALAGVATPLLIQRHSAVQLRRENQDLHQQLARLAAVAQENEQLSNRLAKASALSRDPEQLNELLRLRGEVTQLRDAERKLARLSQQGAKLALAEPELSAPPTGGQPEAARFIYVAGEVNTPGRFIWTNGMTMATVIEIAHGYTEVANRSAAQIKYTTGSSITVNYPEGSAPAATRDLIPPGVTVFVPRRESDTGGQ